MTKAQNRFSVEAVDKRLLMSATLFSSAGLNKGTYNTIQEAIDAAADGAGDVVEIASGTYQENLVINKTDLTIRPGSGQNVVIDAQNIPVPGKGPANGTVAITVQSDDVKIDGNGSKDDGSLTITDAAVGVQADGVKNLDVTDTQFTDLNNTQPGVIRGIYLNGDGADFAEIYRNTFGVTVGTGIDVNGGDSSQIQMNTFNSVDVGVQLRNDADGNNVRQNNQNGGATFATTDGTSSNTFAKNIVKGAETGFHLQSDSNLVGGAHPSEGNMVNDAFNAFVIGGDFNQVQYNLISTDNMDRAANVPNSVGFLVNGDTNNFTANTVRFAERAFQVWGENNTFVQNLALSGTSSTAIGFDIQSPAGNTQLGFNVAQGGLIGFEVTADDAILEQNIASDAGTGIAVEGDNAAVTRNVAFGNGVGLAVGSATQAVVGGQDSADELTQQIQANFSLPGSNATGFANGGLSNFVGFNFFG